MRRARKVLPIVGVALCLLMAAWFGHGDVAALALVAGVFEFLPVSSTAHVMIVRSLVGNESDVQDALGLVEVGVQAGTGLGLAIYFRLQLAALGAGLARGDFAAWRTGVGLIVGFVPVAALGYVVEESTVFGRLEPTMSGALACGGILILIWERSGLGRAARARATRLEEVGVGVALAIGVAQCLALVPGVSRSLATILMGMVLGLGSRAAVEFSFLLGCMVLLAASAFSATDLLLKTPPSGDIPRAVIGLVLALGVSHIAIAPSLRFLARRSLSGFGCYRLCLAAALFLLH